VTPSTNNKKKKVPVKKKKTVKAKPTGYKAKSKYSELESIPSGTNSNITSPSNDFMRNLMGEPRKNKDYAKEDNGLDNSELAKLHTIDDVGPFKVAGLNLAIESLKSILADINKTYPEIYTALGTAGMRSVRLQRGDNPKKKISNHSWGVAIDLKIDGLLDPYKDDKTQHGLALIAPIFNNHRWYWGGAYSPGKDRKGKLHSKEDAMHFEVSREMLLEWAQLGYLGSDAKKFATKNETRKLQGAVKPAKRKEDLISRVLPLISQLNKRLNKSFPNWFGANSRSKKPLSWFR